MMSDTTIRKTVVHYVEVAAAPLVLLVIVPFGLTHAWGRFTYALG